jgi:hypothetical protein
MRARHGKEAAIPPLRWNKKSFYINVLWAGGEEGIRTLGTPQGVQRFSSAGTAVPAFQPVLGCPFLSCLVSI